LAQLKRSPAVAREDVLQPIAVSVAVMSNDLQSCPKAMIFISSEKAYATFY